MEPNKDNSFDTKTVVLFLCLKRLNRAVCRLCEHIFGVFPPISIKSKITSPNSGEAV